MSAAIARDAADTRREALRNRLAVAIQKERDENRQRELQHALGNPRAAGECEGPQRLKILPEVGDETRAIVRDACPIRLRPFADQRNLADPRRRVGWPLVHEPFALLEQHVRVLGERDADDHERREHDQSDDEGHDQCRQRHPAAREALQTDEHGPGRTAEDDRPQHCAQERLQHQVATGDQHDEDRERDPLLDPGTLRRLLRRGRGRLAQGRRR